MEFQEYINEKKELYDIFLIFLDEEDENEIHFNKFIQNIEKHKYQENPGEFKSILHLINEISSNHHRSSTFLEKIHRTLMHYIEYIKQSFTFDELFDIFKKNPIILYFLIKQKIIILDDNFTKLIYYDDDPEFIYRTFESKENIKIREKYSNYLRKKDASVLFYLRYVVLKYIQSDLEDPSEWKKELLEMHDKIFDDFEKICQTGENDSYICQLIREDSVKEFIVYTNKNNVLLSSEIKESIFETNPFILQNGATLIEYAAFFGSIQIFNYLRMNSVILTPKLWLYAIHGNNPEIIHILEDNHIIPNDETYIQCFQESIKCHHNSIARYIEENHLNESNNTSFKKNNVSFGFHYYNYEFILNSQNCKYSLDLKYPFFYACKYDNLPVVKYLVKDKNVDINQTIISNLIFFLMKHTSTFHKILNVI